MASIWSEENRFRKWLDVELAVCKAHCELGTIPEKSMSKIEELADFDVEEIHKKEEETQHEVIAFLNVLQERIGKESRFIHVGLTSSDVMDTAT
ncbi:adenylosuccinate lyase, partial [bacterium]|nr:adenylosuccinate lyase [bacterium]